MKTILRLLIFIATGLSAFGQGTAFTYQGQLNDSGAPANGNYDLIFALFNLPTDGNQVGPALTNLATGVTNGAFTVVLDFGPGIFTGSNLWLDVSVQTNGGGGFTELTPRQAINSTPYAVMAANAASYAGAITDSQLSANVAKLNASQTFSGTETFSSQSNAFVGSFAGSGTALTNLQVTAMVGQTSAAIAWGNDGAGQTNVPPSLNSNNVVAVAAGYQHSLAVKSDGTVVAWGWNVSGQTNVPVGLGGVVAVAAGYEHSLALKSDGTVVAWGDNYYGEASVPAGLNNVIAVAGTYYNSLALKNDGTVVAWGQNIVIPVAFQSNLVAISASSSYPGFYSLGLKSNGTVVSWNGSTLPANLSNVAAIAAAGNGGGLALKNDGTIITWNLGTPPSTNNIIAIAAGYDFGVAVKNDGTVMVWGDASYNLTGFPATLSGVSMVAAGNSHALALSGTGNFAPAHLARLDQVNVFSGINSFDNPNDTFTGSGLGLNNLQVGSIIGQTAGAVAWGNDGSGQTNVPPSLSSNNVLAVAAGYQHSLALKSDGTVVAWGMNNYGQTNVPAGLNGVVAVAGGYYHSLALKSDGTVAAWGDNSFGETSVPAGLNNVVALAGGEYFSLALKSDGTAVGWGQNVNIPLAFQSNLVAISAAPEANYILGLKNNGTVAAWNGSSPPFGLSNVVAIAAEGIGGGLAVKNDGTLVTWSMATPPSTNNIAAIAAGYDFGVAAKKDGTVMVWGDNSYNLTGFPTTLGGVSMVAAGNQHALALRGTGYAPAHLARLDQLNVFSGVNAFNNANDTFTGSGLGLNNLQASSLVAQTSAAVAWGNNSSGQTNVPSSLNGNNVVAVAAGYDHSLALKSDGTVVAWGGNVSGQTNVPAGLGGVVAVAGGYEHSLALKSDGTVVAWGDNTYGETNVPAGLDDVIAVAGSSYTSLALKNDGTVVAWGEYTNMPTAFGNLAAISAAPGNIYVLGLKNNGTVFAWGAAAPPSGLSNVVAVAATGTGGGLALKNDGTIVTWNMALAPQTNNIAAIAAGYDFGVAVKKDGTVMAWGDTSYNLTGFPATLSGVSMVAAGYLHALALRGTGNLTPARLPRLDQVNAFSGVNSFVNSNNSFAGNGAGLTALNASSLSTGTVADALLSTNVALLNANQAFTGANLLTNSGNIFAGLFSGDGSGLTNLNASQLTSGTVPLAQLPPAVVTNNAPAVTLGGTFSGAFAGDGSALTNLTFPAGLTTNIVVTVPTGTVTLFFTNGILMQVQ